MSAQLTGNGRDPKRMYDAADLGDALGEARKALADETSTLDPEAVRLKVALEMYTQQAEERVRSIEFHVARLDNASATLQTLLGDKTPPVLFADAGSGVYTALPPSRTIPSVASDSVEVTPATSGGASVRTRPRR